MKTLSIVLVGFLSLWLYGCNGQNQEQDRTDNISEADGTAVYEDHEVDSITIRVDESTESLEREIDVVQNEVDSLLED